MVNYFSECNPKERLGAKGDCGSFHRPLPPSWKSRQQSSPFYNFAINPMLIDLVRNVLAV